MKRVIVPFLAMILLFGCQSNHDPYPLTQTKLGILEKTEDYTQYKPVSLDAARIIIPFDFDSPEKLTNGFRFNDVSIKKFTDKHVELNFEIKSKEPDINGMYKLTISTIGSLLPSEYQEKIKIDSKVTGYYREETNESELHWIKNDLDYKLTYNSIEEAESDWLRSVIVVAKNMREE
ncbi:hypothetical protein [Bacillus cereus]|uniref:Lipoprotein n=1 Tax=Bacillus cereus TaxID=1396 RepID=A0A164K8F9_BACCE|nr:hypothetical protein [Bacillus cereus]KZD48682.1 hypothetical protein B4088_6610 [Bacillus cereus]